MKITVDKRALNCALKKIKWVAPRKSSIAILSNVKLKARGNNIEVRGTDLDLDLCFNIPGKGEGEACFDAVLLEDLTRPENSLDQGVVEISDGKEQNQTALCIDDLVSHLRTDDPKDYPEKELGRSKKVVVHSVESLLDELVYVQAAICEDITRPHISSVFFTGRDVVCTDGHRLHKGELPRKAKEEFLLKVDALAVLVKLLRQCDKQDKIGFAVTDNRVFVSGPNWILSSKKPEATFPPYDQVIPASDNFEITLDRKEALRVFKRAAKLSGKDGGLIFKFEPEGVVLKTESGYRGESQTELKCKENTFADKFELVCLQAQYAIEGLEVGEEIRIGFSGGLDPAVFRGEGGRVAVVMPRRI